MPTYPRRLTWSLAIALLLIQACGQAPLNAPTIANTSSEAALDLKHPGGGHLVLESPLIADRRLMAWAEQVECYKINLVRLEENGDEVEVLRNIELRRYGEAMISVLNLMPGAYRLAIEAHDIDGQELQKSAPDAHPSESFQILAYQVTTLSVTVPLQDNVLTFIAPPEKPRSSSSGRSSRASSTSQTPTPADAGTGSDSPTPEPTDAEPSDETSSPSPEASPTDEASPTANEPSPAPEPSETPTTPTPAPSAETKTETTGAPSDPGPVAQEKGGTP